MGSLRLSLLDLALQEQVEQRPQEDDGAQRHQVVARGGDGGAQDVGRQRELDAQRQRAAEPKARSPRSSRRRPTGGRFGRRTSPAPGARPSRSPAPRRPRRPAPASGRSRRSQNSSTSSSGGGPAPSILSENRTTSPAIRPSASTTSDHSRDGGRGGAGGMSGVASMSSGGGSEASPCQTVRELGGRPRASLLVLSSSRSWAPQQVPTPVPQRRESLVTGLEIQLYVALDDKPVRRRADVCECRRVA